ncbi:HNH endonuclease [Nakamurella aerolata]|uniref:HNH endonuclease n=1 Tax=Nakamurella aerolata TaxID=1656892 RepID=A0A849A0F2_9ACTN|nr:HNH endonuclease [Nakamurella aerolata]NNG34534.1 HNH endonuclease [Nakamurella aerolata]
MSGVLLINASYQVLCRIEWQRAITLLVTEAADAIENHPSEVVRSKFLTVPLPLIVRLRTYVHVDVGRIKQLRDRQPSYAQVRLRDRRTCAYCGEHGDTVDHIVPQSRGGQNTWDNLITACRECNNRKADRTPLEAGMRLLWTPRPPEADGADQQLVWDALGVG